MSFDYANCAELIDQADGLLITAGAGMGVDSGLPDFRGPQGFWRAYPALGRARIPFEQIASPSAFKTYGGIRVFKKSASASVVVTSA